MTPAPEHVKALRAVLDAILEAVAEAGPTGAPGGVIYAALMAQGCSLSQYQSLMDGLVSVRRLRRQGDLYFIAQARTRVP